jgi:phosphomannomutase / phosphoglucomutase
VNEPLFDSAAYFTEPLIDPYGLREYDARWVIEPLSAEDRNVQLNYYGARQLGNALGRFLRVESGGEISIVVGHDFRKYSENVKNAVVVGLLSAGLEVYDIGLATSPMAYFAQYAHSVPAVAMVTASHNPNGWTGLKMGDGLSQTFTPVEMARFKSFLASEEPFESAPACGPYHLIHDVRDSYLQDLHDSWAQRLEGLPRLRIAVETGNGTAGIVAPDLLRSLGFDVVEGHTRPDWNFPHFNPNPESIAFLRAVEALVSESGADVGLCLDGDADRLGVVDDRARLVFADRLGLLIARRLEQESGTHKFVVDVKSTSLFDTVLESEVVWVPTGHSYVKSALAETGSTAGFERSGHYFFAEPFGRGYDDGCVAGLALAWVLCEAKRDGRALSDLLNELPPSHQSPNRQPTVPEAQKYQIVERVAQEIERQVEEDGTFADKPVARIVKVNGTRVEYDDGTWLLVRASSNTPNLVIVAESFDDDGQTLRSLDAAVRGILEQIPEVGEFEPLYD